MLVSFAYRDLDDVKKKEIRIREGGSNADMIQDLIELAVLGEKYPEPPLAKATRLKYCATRLIPCWTKGPGLFANMASMCSGKTKTN